MWTCRQPAITDAAFVHLRGVHTLVIEGCNPDTITGTTLAHLKSIHALGMYNCSDEQVATARSLGLPVHTRDCTSCGALHYTFDERTEDESQPRGLKRAFAARPECVPVKWVCGELLCRVAEIACKVIVEHGAAWGAQGC